MLPWEARPHLIARMGDSRTIIAVKTGRPSPSRGVQGMLYMDAVPSNRDFPARFLGLVAQVSVVGIQEVPGWSGLLHQEMTFSRVMGF